LKDPVGDSGLWPRSRVDPYFGTAVRAVALRSTRSIQFTPPESPAAGREGTCRISLPTLVRKDAHDLSHVTPPAGSTPADCTESARRPSCCTATVADRLIVRRVLRAGLTSTPRLSLFLIAAHAAGITIRGGFPTIMDSVPRISNSMTWSYTAPTAARRITHRPSRRWVGVDRCIAALFAWPVGAMEKLLD